MEDILALWNLIKYPGQRNLNGPQIARLYASLLGRRGVGAYAALGDARLTLGLATIALLASCSAGIARERHPLPLCWS